MSAVASLEGVTKRYADRTVLDGVTLGVGERDRIGVIGLNGSGKATLLRLAAGVDEPDAGSVVRGNGVPVRYLPQEPELDPAATPLEIVLAGPRAFDPLTDRADVQREQRARAMLDRVGVGAVDAPAGRRSGGQRKRVALAAALADRCELLVLDEPTNDLDIDTLGVLEAGLDTWGGTVVVASHDRFFLDRVCRDLYALEDGAARHHPGGWSAYRASAPERPAQARRTRQSEARRGAGDPAPSRKRKRSYHEERELAQLTGRIAVLEVRKADLAAALQAAGDDYARAAALGEELAAVVSELDILETRWIELAEIGED